MPLLMKTSCSGEKVMTESVVFFALCRDFMDPTMDSTKHILNYLMPILERVDPELHRFMLRYDCIVSGGSRGFVSKGRFATRGLSKNRSMF